MGHSDQTTCTTVKWGAILAGAAVVAGAVLLAPSGTIQSIVSWASGFFGQKAGEEVATSTFSQIIQKMTEMFGNVVASETTKQVTGAALLGGGAAYLLGGKGDAQQEFNEELARDNRESFADRENMRKTQMKMLVQASAAGNPEAQAMMAQMQGR